MKRAVFLGLSLFVSLPATLYSSQRLSEDKPTPEALTLDQVLDRYVQALGGKSAIEKISTRASKGAFTSDHLKTNGPVELYAKAPNKQLMVLLAKGIGNYRRGFDGSVAWEMYPGSDKANDVSGFSKRDAEFYLAVKFRETYPNVALKGTEKLEEREAYVLEAPAAGKPKRWSFDTQTGLLLRTETRHPKGKVLESADYSDYRAVDGIREPFSIRQVDSDGTDFDIKLTEVRHNIPIDDKSFDKSAGHSHSAVSANATKEKPQVRFTSGNSAKIPFEYTDDDNEILKVRVNDSPPLNFTIDTGSDVFAIITARQAGKLGLTPRNNYKVGGIVGDIEAASIPSANLSLPGVEALNQRLEVLISNVSTDADGPEIDGVLGLEFLKKFIVEIDYEAKTINLLSPENYRYSGPGEIISIKIQDGSPLVRAKMTSLSGKIIESYFEIDSGMGGTLLFCTPAVRKYGLLEEMQTIQAPTSIETGGEFNRRIGRAKSLQLGRFTIENPTVSLAQNVDREGGVIGEEILRRFKVIYDFSNRRIILEPNSHFKEPYEEDMSGMAVIPEMSGGQKVFRIRQILMNTPAAEVGLHEGDLIVAIDGKPSADFTAGRLARMFMQYGREFVLSIKRGDKAMQTRLKLKRLI